MRLPLQDIDAMMERLYPPDLPGAALLVRKNGDVLEKGYGLAEVSTCQWVTIDTNFRTASVTKQFTACCILLLAAEKRISLDDPIVLHLPSLHSALETVTIRHLLTHTSGIRDYEDLIPSSFNRQLSDADVLQLVGSKSDTYFLPGQGFRYSNTGYCLLALVVEKVTGLEFGDFLRKRIFAPAGMEDAILYERGVSIPHRAFGYRREGDKYAEADQSITSVTGGDGGIYLSLKNYLKWHEALEKHLLLPTTYTEALFSAAIHVKGTIGYGYGWFTGKEKDGSGCRFHSGESSGFRNMVYFNRERDLLLVLFSNREDGAIRAFGEISRLLDIETVQGEGNLMKWMEGVYTERGK